jgi:hypothetical protein
MGRVCQGAILESGPVPTVSTRLSACQLTWLRESIHAMQCGAAPTFMGDAVRREIEARFTENYAALTEDDWTRVAKRGLEAAESAGRLAAELARLDNSAEIRRRHALAGLRAVKAICDRSMRLSRLAESEEPALGIAGTTSPQAGRAAA